MPDPINHTLLCLRMAAECQWVAIHVPSHFRAPYIGMVSMWTEMADEAPPKTEIAQEAVERSMTMPTLLGRTILVVEDDAIVSLEIAQLLREWGCLVIGPARSVAGALRHVPLHMLDGAVVDFRLGGELATPILDALASAGVPAVIVTGYPTHEAYAHHREEVIRKPFDSVLLLDALRRVIGLASTAKSPKNALACIPAVDERLSALIQDAQLAGDRHIALAIGASLWKNRPEKERFDVLAAEATSARADMALADYRTSHA